MANLTSGREYLQNIIKETYQQTGAIGSIETISERNSFVSSVKQFESGYVVNWQSILHPLISGLETSDFKKYSGVRSGPWAEYDGLDSQYGGLSGWTLTAEPWATEDGLECLWDKTKSQPNSITAVLYCLSNKIDEISILSNQDVDIYDDSEIRSKILCLENDFLRIYKEAIGCDASLKCSSEKSLEYSVLRHVYEIFEQVIDGGPNIPNLFDCEKDYPELSIKLLVSNLIFDVLIDQKYISGLTADLTCIREWIGKYDSVDCTPTYGLSAELNYISNGDNLVESIFKLDQALKADLQGAYDYGDKSSGSPGWIELSVPTENQNSVGTFILSNHRDLFEYADDLEEAQALVTIFADKLMLEAGLTQSQVDTVNSLGGFTSSNGAVAVIAVIGTQPYLDLLAIYQVYASSVISKVRPVADSLGDAAYFDILDQDSYQNDNSVDSLARSNLVFRVENHPIYRNPGINSETTLPEEVLNWKYGSVNLMRSVMNMSPKTNVPKTMKSGVSYGDVVGYDQTAIWVANGVTEDLINYTDCHNEPVGDDNLYYRKPGNGQIYKLNLCPGEVDIGSLKDVQDSLPQMNDILLYNNTSDTWQMETLELDAVQDVDLSTLPSDGQALAYNSASQSWIPQTISGTSNDNLGNHIATQDLTLSEFDILNVHNISLTSTVASPHMSLNVSGGNLNFNSQIGSASSTCDYNFGAEDGKPASLNVETGSGTGVFSILADSTSGVKQSVTMPAAQPTSTGQVLSVNTLTNTNQDIQLEWATISPGSTSAGSAGTLQLSDGAGGFNAASWSESGNNILPSVNDSYDIGSASFKVRDLFLGPASLKIGKTSETVDPNHLLSIGTDGVFGNMEFKSIADQGSMLYRFKGQDGAPAAIAISSGTNEFALTVPDLLASLELKLPVDMGTTGQVLSLNTNVNATKGEFEWVTPATGGLTEVSEDLTPALGGNLDLAGSNITGTGNVDINGSITANLFKGPLEGAVHFEAKAGENLLKGETVYVSGISGNNPIVMKAQANGDLKMPAFGIMGEDVALNNLGNVVTFGSQVGLNVINFGETGITFNLGDTLYISATEAGRVTNVPPSGESNRIQNIGKIERISPTSNASIKVGGAGRTNATPALDSGSIFIGDLQNKSVTVKLQEEVEDIVGAMVSGNVENGIDVNYDDLTGKLNFNVALPTTYTNTIDYGNLNGTVIDPHDSVEAYCYFSGGGTGKVGFDYSSTTNGGWQSGQRFRIRNLNLDNALPIEGSTDGITAKIKVVGAVGIGSAQVQFSLDPGARAEGFFDGTFFLLTVANDK